MKTNTSKERSFYTQSQRFAARVLLIVWLLASVNAESILAAPGQAAPITNSPENPSPRAQEMANIAQLSSYILLAKRSHFGERTATTEQLSATLADKDKGVCVLHGFGGVGKSTLASLYGHGRKDTHTVRWIGAENNFKLQEGYQQLAQELQVAYQPLAKKLAANASQYRQELARMVYQALEKSSQPTLLILDNAQDASLVADYLLHRPAAIQAIITTRSAEAFEGKYDQLQLGPFSQDQGEGYLEVRFKEMNRAYTPQEVASLLEEVGQVPQKLELAASYLQSYELLTTAQYIARLQALKQASTNQQSRRTLPEVALGLQTLTKAGQQLMQYAAYLATDATIPLSLVSALLEEDAPEQLSKVVYDLSRLSLMQVVLTNAGQKGLQVHQEVQASCREYAGWSPEAALGTQETILLKLAEKLQAQRPFVESAPNDRWQLARLYAPHVATVVTALEDSGTAPSAVVARLLMLMGIYSQQVRLNYRQAVRFYERALAIFEQVYQETPNHLDIANTLNNLGAAWKNLGDAGKAVSFLERALAIKEQIYQETPHHLDIASALNNLGLACRALGDARKAKSYYERALAIYEQSYQETPNHPSIASTLVGLGIAWSTLRDAKKAVKFLERALAIYEQSYQETPNHPDIASTLVALGIAWSTLKDAKKAVSFLERALAIYKQSYQKTPNHPDIANTLNTLGAAWGTLGDSRKAVSFLERALAIYKQSYQETPNHPDIAGTLNNLGNAWSILGDARKAVSFLERALAIREQIYQETPNHPDIASTLNNLGAAWKNLGDAHQAVSFYKRALAIYEQSYQETPNHPSIASTLNNLGIVYAQNLSDYKQALEYYQKALQMQQALHEGENHAEVAVNLRTVGVVYERLGNYTEALKYYQKALQMQQALHEGENHAEVAQLLQNIGNVHYSSGYLEQAIQSYEEALAVPAVSQAMKASTGHNLGCICHVTALTVRQEGDEQQAQAYLEKATTNFEQAVQDSGAVKADLYTEYGNFLLNTGKTSQAHDYLRQAIESGDDEPGLSYSLPEQPTVTPVLQAYLSQHQKILLRSIDYAYYLMIHHYEDFQKAGIQMAQTRETYLAAYQAALDQRSGPPGQEKKDTTAYHLLGSLYTAQGDQAAAAAAFARAQNGTEPEATQAAVSSA